MAYLNDLAREIFDIATSKGWHDRKVAFGDALTNIHGEVSEAWEEYRNGKMINETYYVDKGGQCDWCDKLICDNCPNHKPEGIPSEFADIIIRTLDCCAMYNIDIDSIIQEKMRYNKQRPYKHGGKIV